MNWSNPVLQAPIPKSRILTKSSKKEAPPETTEDASKHNYSRGDGSNLSRARPRRKLPELQGALKLDLDPVRKNPTRRFIHPAFARGSGYRPAGSNTSRYATFSDSTELRIFCL